jgi:hypothetical protein
VPFFIRLLDQESNFRPHAISTAGALGMAQFMPETAADRGLDNPFDPLQAIPASARLLRDLSQKFGNLGLAAAAYNAGPRRVEDWLASKAKLPQETQNYVKTITGWPAETWTVASRHPGGEATATRPARRPRPARLNGPDQISATAETTAQDLLDHERVSSGRLAATIECLTEDLQARLRPTRLEVVCERKQTSLPMRACTE